MKLRKGETLYTMLRKVSKSGMYREIDVVAMRQNRPVSILAILPEKQKAEFLKQYPMTRKGDRAFKTRGAGMDMGFDMVYNLGRITRKDGYAFKQSWL